MSTWKKIFFGALLGALMLGGCDCEEKGRLVSKQDPDGSGGNGGGTGGSGGDWVERTPCEQMCDHVEGHCRLQVPGLYEDCPSQCEELLTPDERDCLRGIECSMDEVERCLGGGDACEDLCAKVYDQCGREIVYGEGSAAVEREHCETICPLLDEGYRSCLEQAKTCPEIDACHGGPQPPSGCEEMCERVYDFCGETIDQPGRSYADRGACEAACADGAFSEEEVDCLRTAPCTKLQTCFGPSACERMCERVYDFCGETIDQPGRSYADRAACDAACADGKFTEEEVSCLLSTPCTQLSGCFGPTACESMCDKIYDECNYALPVGARKEDKVDRDRCVSDCERGKFTENERLCVEEEACEYLATCFDDVSRSCASACYWVYNHCDVELGLIFQCFGGDCPAMCWMPPYGNGGDPVWFEGEGACFDFCQFGYQYNGICNPRTVPAWSSQLKTCYSNAAKVYDYHQCKPAIIATGGPLDQCDLLYGSTQ